MKQLGLPGGIETTEAAASKEIAMAKAKKSAAARNKSSRRGKASVKPARKKTVKHAARKKSSSRSKAKVKSARKDAEKRAAPKKVKSKVRRANKLAPKPEMEVKRAPDVAEARQAVAEVPVETSIITVIEEPTGVLAVEEYQEEKQVPEAAETGQVVAGCQSKPRSSPPSKSRPPTWSLSRSTNRFGRQPPKVGMGPAKALLPLSAGQI
jgi:hypothetical protein